MVPLKNAWIVSIGIFFLLCVHNDKTNAPNLSQSGASAWTTAKREEFANDITRPQLWAVTDNVNQAKSDQSPATWKPPLTSFYCVYARSWVQVKSYWELTISSAEKTALTSMLATC